MRFKFEVEFVEDRDDYFVEVCANRKVLHIGACDAPYTLEKHRQGLLLHDKLIRVCREIVGIDVDCEAIRIMSDLGYKNVLCVDLNKANEIDFVPEVIVFGETIEHLMNLEVALTGIKKIMNKDCELLISTPNAFCLYNFYLAIKNQEAVNEDHKHYFSPQTLKQLLEANNLSSEEIIFTFLPREKESFTKKLSKKFIRYFPMLAETLVFRCKLK